MGDNLKGLVKFIYGTQSAYDEINEYDENALYFLTDTNKLYKGDTLIANYVNERVIAAALVDLNNTTTLIQQNVNANTENIENISTKLSDIGEVVQEEIQPLIQRVTDLSTNIEELDEVFAAVANDLNDRIFNIDSSFNNINNQIIDVSSTLNEAVYDISTLSGMFAIVGNDLNSKIENLSNNIPGIDGINEMLNDLTANVENVSTDLSELDYIIAQVGTQLDERLVDVSTMTEENHAQLSWIVIQN